MTRVAACPHEPTVPCEASHPCGTDELTKRSKQHKSGGTDYESLGRLCISKSGHRFHLITPTLGGREGICRTHVSSAFNNPSPSNEL
jgi:hypothetical protein